MTFIENPNQSILKKLSQLTFTQFQELVENDEEHGEKSGKKDEYKIHNQYAIIKKYDNLVTLGQGKAQKKYQLANGSKCGRQFVEGAGIQKLKCNLRGALCEGIYYDYDMKNCHPQLLLYLCKQKNITCKYLKQYVNDRDDKLEDLCDDLDISRSESKNMFIMSLFSKRHIKKHNKKKIDNSFYLNFDKEMKMIQKEFLDIYSHRKKEIRKKEKDNLEGQLLSYILQELEDKVLHETINNLNVSVKMFDGFMSSQKYDIEMLNEKTKQYKIKWDIKDHETEIIDLLEDIEPEGKISFIGKDILEVYQYLLETLYKNKLVKCDGELYYKDDLKWIEGKTIPDKLFDDISNCDLYINGLYGYEPIHSDNQKIKNVIEFLTKKAPTNDDLIMDIWQDSKNKLYFKNCFYDFNTSKFNSKKEDRNTFIYVNRDFDFKRNDEIKKQIYDKIFNPIFTIKSNDDLTRIQLRDNYLHRMARVFAGKIEDKNFFALTGSRDCGKGLINNLYENSFGQYVKTTNAQNFMYKPNMGDTAKNQSFMLNYQFARLVAMSEIETDPNGKQTVFDGNKFKKFHSGGDKLEARANYKDEKQFKIQSVVCIYTNDLPIFQPSDARDKLIEYNLKSQFIDENTKEEFSTISYYKKDDSIKDKFIFDKKVQNELIHIIIDAFGEKVEYPKDCHEELETDENSDTKTLIDLFDFTGNPKDFVTNKELKEQKTHSKLIFNMAKIKLLLKGKGAKDYRSSNERGLKCIRIKKVE